MSDALIGSTGFVGGALLRQRSFDALFRSTNIDSIRGRAFDLVVCAGVSAEKWRANRDPDEDQRKIGILKDALAHITVRRFVLISTVDVYPAPAGVDEDSRIDSTLAQPYGRHRYELEEFCRAAFDATVVRLPAMFGTGLKKNALFDLLNDKPVDSISANSRFQFYDVDRVWADVQRVWSMNVPTANITSEPIAMGEIAERIFHRSLAPLEPSVSYDVRSVYASAAGGRNGYWYDAASTMREIEEFVARERGS